VFVCRYAYAVYQLRQRNFTYEDAGLRSDDSKKLKKKKGAFYHLITADDEFDFDMDDIVRFRDEFKVLIENLSKLFLDMKQAEKEERRKLKQKQEDEEEKENVMAVAEPSRVVDEEQPDGPEAPEKLASNADGAIIVSSTIEKQTLPSTSANMEVETVIAAEKLGGSEGTPASESSEVFEIAVPHTIERQISPSNGDRSYMRSTSESPVQTMPRVDVESNSSAVLAFGDQHLATQLATDRLEVEDGVETEGTSSSSSRCSPRDAPPHGRLSEGETDQEFQKVKKYKAYEEVDI
jgi:hypothetical protein